MNDINCFKCVHWGDCKIGFNLNDCPDYRTAFEKYEIEKMLKDTYLELAQYDISKLPKSDSDKVAVIASKFRNIKSRKMYGVFKERDR